MVDPTRSYVVRENLETSEHERASVAALLEDSWTAYPRPEANACCSRRGGCLFGSADVIHREGEVKVKRGQRVW